MTAVERLCELIRMPTVSAYDPSEEDQELFASIPNRIAELYPAAHSAMERELVGDRGILYKWEGSDPALQPILGMAHYDVVPPGNLEDWVHPPFSGLIADGRIHGRGSLDDKGMLSSWMEAVSLMVEAGFKPVRTLYLAFGGDEETTGVRGAGSISKLFNERGLRFAGIFDEGGALAVDQLKAFTDKPVALVGIAEKGYLTLKLSASGMAGHASAPPKHSAIGRLALALSALESQPASPRLSEAPKGLLKALGGAGNSLTAALLRRPGLFGGILAKALAANATTAPLVRTTLAPTVIKGGERDNVLPSAAEAMVNLRLLPGDSVASATARVRSIIDKAVDEGVTVEVMEQSAFEPVPACKDGGPWWETLKKIVGKHFPEAVLAPYLMTGSTDSRWYQDQTDAIYRFIPMAVTSAEMACVHAANESVSLEAWEKSVDFLKDLLIETLN